MYKFTNRRLVREAIRLLHRNFPDKERLEVAVVVEESGNILIQVNLRGKVRVHEEIFAQGILSSGKPVEMAPEEFARVVLEAPESYLGSAALAFPISRPGERVEEPHGG